ncbi:universal stress protein [Streptomyces sp. HB132]|uniref:universal stress protein n=1 Tax=Streptomyces sp. HB132 TaxID=767388 RepID=UPI00195F63A0|nr:universal stress protein [Streptomyces sp. HB132]MBM7440250.1 nucleotide-binding universal stress UspA family protein [Streptomyces sp. HB132]
MTGNVTAGLNGTPESFAAVRWAAREASLRQLPLRIIHVREWPLTAEVPVPPQQSEEDEALLEKAARTAGLDRPGLDITTDNLSGDNPTRTLMAEVDAPGRVELLVLGSRGLNALAGFLVGSTSLPVVAASERPVVLVRSEDPADAVDDGTAPGGEELVLGVDLKEAGADEGLLAFGFTEAARRNSRLRVLHAWSLPATYSYAQTADPGLGDELAGHITDTLERTVAPWRERFPDVTVQARAVVGTPGAELVYASPGAGLLMVGRRRRRHPMGPRLGHVAHAVIHHAACPVAVVPHV